MIELEYLTKLLELSKQHGIKKIKMEGLELDLAESITGPSAIQEEIKHSGSEQMPVDLRADDMNYDKVLHWSGSPAHEETPLPLTGEEGGP